ncbi:sugar ABC transporter ATP-binding protein [Tropicimonas marinistellae]|uniref:sugar ABC transporter ATP-binding protein n=1 Tax=Tropicimonas marinistellae TaxID=1739787 RepID=UPI00082B1EF3|nr:sugar ABC transporter ATP-binding protein [Tropicimonas marinistellae]
MSALLELKSVSKSFGPTLALNALDFDLLPGEVHALVGENGAGKSTALGLIYGVIAPDNGQVEIEGNRQSFRSTSDAQAAGVSCVFQELSLAGGLTVAENIFAGHPRQRFGVVNWKRLQADAAALLSEFELNLDVRKTVDSLPVSARQVVEIAKALSLEAKILLLDEPTSALAPDEVESLFGIVRKLKERGIGVIYVSHHLSEIFRISDRITVMRDGQKVATHRTSETTEKEVVSQMVGRLATARQERAPREIGAAVFQARDLSLTGIFDDVSFDVRAGEIVGLAGLLGSRSKLIARAVAGLLPAASGRMSLCGRAYAPRSLREGIAAGAAFVPEERKTEGLFLDETNLGNLAAANLGAFSRRGLFQRKVAARATERAIDQLEVKTSGPEQTTGALSGGNQQKILLAKWLETQPRLLVLNEPTKGVDIGAKRKIHEELERCAKDGMAILLASSDFPELLGICDRILVVRDGRIVGETDPQNFNEDDLLSVASGAQQLPALVHEGADS